MMYQAIENLIAYEIKHNVITKRDYTYVKNQIYQLLDLPMKNDVLEAKDIQYPAQALEIILDEAYKIGRIQNSQIERDLFDSKLMNIFADKPSVVESIFQQKYKENKRDATLWYYHYVQSLNYIRMERIAKNKAFTTSTPFGDLQITINLSKPEKDPKSIMLQAKAEHTQYPSCVLCVENEGFSGNLTRDSRQQHRLIQLTLNQEHWYFQYSPYIYFNEHAIVINEKHRPMKIDMKTFENLLSLVDQFEGYFFGSNADLPIVGGSILYHDHYQGGVHTFPIEHATPFYTELKETYQIDLLNWPLSTVKLTSSNKEELSNKAYQLLNAWKTYENKDLDIVCDKDDIRHHTITPIATKERGVYHMYLILRDNHTNDEHPLGVFHPHEDVWHIKKENIGLIEAVGLGILPGRLINELEAVKKYIILDKPLEQAYVKHQAWANEIKSFYDKKQDIDLFINQQVGLRFLRVLNDCGVFKQKAKDKDDMISFIKGVFA